MCHESHRLRKFTGDELTEVVFGSSGADIVVPESELVERDLNGF
jgi:hypothetical protein